MPIPRRLFVLSQYKLLFEEREEALFQKATRVAEPVPVTGDARGAAQLALPLASEVRI